MDYRFEGRDERVIKNNKWKLMIASIIILLPMVVGLLLWEQLPEQLATHWGIDGAANGWSSKHTAVVGMPLFFLVIQWICVAVTAADPKNKGQNKKVFRLVLWIAPMAAVLGCGSIYANAFGVDVSFEKYAPALLGLMFVIIGNYLPKCKQNHTIGIKVPWTLNDEENWNKTHRLASKLWVVGGVIIMAVIFFAGTDYGNSDGNCVGCSGDCSYGVFLYPISKCTEREIIT